MVDIVTRARNPEVCGVPATMINSRRRATAALTLICCPQMAHASASHGDGVRGIRKPR